MQGGVTATYSSSHAELTAREISRRLFNRWYGQTGDVNPCPTS